jgi:hypothetical protein
MYIQSMSKTIQKICKWCNKEFLADSREVNRGGAKFCSLSCSANFTNLYKVEILKTCKFCEHPYKTKSKTSLYCSKTCTNKARRARSVKSGNQGTHRGALQRKVIKILGLSEFKCFICNWNESFCDIHHIKPKASGGSDDLDNLTVLCPNHHRLADRKLLLVSLPSVSERYRTISSSD